MKGQSMTGQHTKSPQVTEHHIRRLVFWNRFWLILFLLLLVGGGIAWLDHFISNTLHPLRVHWMQDGSIRLSSSSDGPFVVTHLSKVALSEGSKAVAQISPPIVIVDSAGATLSRDDVARLKWYSYIGEPQPALAAGTPIVAFYYRPVTTEPSQVR